MHQLLLNNNHLLTLPAGLSSLTGLTYLDVAKNRLRQLPELGLAEELTVLIANNNHLESLPDLSANLLLAEVVLFHNRLTQLDTLADNPNLGSIESHYIDASHNMLGTASCNSIEILKARTELSGATFLYTTQGNFTQIWPQLPSWVNQPTSLQGMVGEVTNATFVYSHACE